MKKEVLQKYANLIVTKGGNVQEGQDVIITIEVDQYEFAKLLVEECYKAKASKVTVNWSYQEISKLHYNYQSEEVLSTVLDWEKARLQHYVDRIPVQIHILSQNPDGMKGVDQQKITKARMATYPITKPYNDALENKYQWTIAAVPSVAWAKKVFPELSEEEAYDKLWEAILYTTRVTEDPIKEWDEHNKDLEERSRYLNSLGLVELRYKSSNGTDFKVGLIEDCLFCGGGEKALGSGIYYNPNMPTEEIFTSPKKGVAEGVVYSTKPLSYRGEIIDNFSMRFEGGKVVEVHAEKNEELLKQMISLDEGASYLGECALVPFDSPISNSKILFFNTLFDENASCHLAVGRGFSNLIKDYEKYTNEELEAKGINSSMSHVDFMIGCEDLSIVGVDKEGKEHQIFKNGNWAF